MKTTDYFLVAIEGTDVPPGWSDQMEAKLRRELELSFGNSVTVRHTDPPAPRVTWTWLRRRP